MKPSRKYRTAKQRRRMRVLIQLYVLGIFLLGMGGAAAWWFFFQEAPVKEEEEVEEFFFIQTIEYPDWFADSLLNLPEDLKKAVDEGKKGLMLYFARENCACCELMMEVNFGDPAVIAYIQRYFNVVAIDSWGHMPVTNFDGQQHSEARFAKMQGAEATPSILFFNTEGEKIFQVRGYHSPYEFKAVLDYVLTASENSEDFKDYLQNLGRPELFGYFELHDNPGFSAPPYYLDRRGIPGERPLAVFFEEGNCPACDLLHMKVLKRPEIRRHLENIDLVQLDLTENIPLVTPWGEKLNASTWARQLRLDYTPSLVFFDEYGNYMTRADSAAQVKNLDHILRYVLSQKTRQPESIKTPKLQALTRQSD